MVRRYRGRQGHRCAPIDNHIQPFTKNGKKKQQTQHFPHSRHDVGLQKLRKQAKLEVGLIQAWLSLYFQDQELQRNQRTFFLSILQPCSDCWFWNWQSFLLPFVLWTSMFRGVRQRQPQRPLPPSNFLLIHFIDVMESLHPMCRVWLFPSLMPKFTIFADAAFERIKELDCELVRYVPWYPYPHIAVAELSEPTANSTSWVPFIVAHSIFSDLSKTSGFFHHRSDY